MNPESLATVGRPMFELFEKCGKTEWPYGRNVECKKTLMTESYKKLFHNAKTWTTTRALERRIDGIYTRLLRRALHVSWQQHMTNQELYGKIPSAMHQLRERRLTFAGHCYQCEDQPVKHLVLWEGKAGGCSEDKPTA